MNMLNKKIYMLVYDNLFKSERKREQLIISNHPMIPKSVRMGLEFFQVNGRA